MILTLRIITRPSATARRSIVRASGTGWTRPLAADRALVNRAARRLGHPASIPRAIMSRSPEALTFGARRDFIPASLSLPLCGALLTGLATAVGPSSRCGSRVGAMLTLLRLPLSSHRLHSGPRQPDKARHSRRGLLMAAR
jgi:hypothetical protein